jgi:hypothetical protein
MSHEVLQVRVSEVVRHDNIDSSESGTGELSFAKLRGARKPEVTSVNTCCKLDGAKQHKHSGSQQKGTQLPQLFGATNSRATCGLTEVRKKFHLRMALRQSKNELLCVAKIMRLEQLLCGVT